MANLYARLPQRQSVITAVPPVHPAPSMSGGEFGLRGMGDTLAGESYVAVDDADESGRRRTMYVSPKTPVADIYGNAPAGTSGDFNASRRRILDSADDYIQSLQGKTDDAGRGVTTPKGKGGETPLQPIGGRSPRVEAGEDYSDRSYKKFNAGETSAKGSTAMRANLKAMVIMDARRKKEELAKHAGKIETILSEMSRKSP